MLLYRSPSICYYIGPHSIWCGRVQRWYWVLRREERGDEFEGAPLSIVVSPKKECQEAAQLMLKV